MSETEVDIPGESNEHSPFHQKRVIPFEKYLRSLFSFSLIFSLLFFMDGFLPEKRSLERVTEWFMMVEDAKIKHYTPVYEMNNLAVYYKIKTEENSIALDKESALQVKEGDTLRVTKTPVFRTIKNVELLRKSYSFKPYVYGYGLFLLLPLLLIATSLTGLFRQLKDDLLYSLGVIQILALGAFIVMRLFYM